MRAPACVALGVMSGLVGGCVSPQLQQQDQPAAKAEAAPADDGVSFERNVEYGKVGEDALTLNIAWPKDAAGKLPLIVVFHGGAWRAGDKSMHDAQIREFAKKGYVSATVGYRFCPTHRYPAQVQDAQCAVRFLRASAEKYHIDPERVGAIGFSAGAHLSMMLGTLDAGDGPPETGGSGGQPAKVQAVVAYFGPTDMLFRVPEQASPLLVEFFGGTPQDKGDLYRHASPVNHVNRGDPPMLLFQGTGDSLVPFEHATHMAEAMQKAGVDGRVELLVGGGHGNWAPAEYTRTFAAAVAFFDEQLKTVKKKPRF